MIRDNKVHMIPSTIQSGKKDGMVSLDQELARMVKAGIITEIHAREKTTDIAEFERYMKSNTVI